MQSIDKAIDLYLSREEFDDALLISFLDNGAPQTKSSNVQIHNITQEQKADSEGKAMYDKDADDGGSEVHVTPIMIKIISQRAGKHFRNSDPVIAAACYLSINDVQKAMQILVRGYELEIAFAVSKLLHELLIYLYAYMYTVILSFL